MIDEKVLKNEERAIFALRSLYRRFGYLPFKMSKFEEYDLYVANKDFLVSDRVITFNDTTGKLLALKPDVTLSIIKNSTNSDSGKYKVFYNENVYRISGGTGRFKEIMQAGLECIGDIDVTDIHEAVSLAAMSLSLVSDEYVLDISHMGLLSAILDDASDSEIFKREITSLISEKNAHEARALCEKYSVSADMTERVVSLTSLYGDINGVMEKLSEIVSSPKAREALESLREVITLLSKEEFADKLRLDFSVVNNMNYYDGIVFKGFIPGVYEGVLSGGEYGKLLHNMGKELGAVGFALYLDPLSELDVGASDVDVDVLLVYSEDTPKEKVIERKRVLTSLGKSVCCEKCIPAKLRYGSLEKI